RSGNLKVWVLVLPPFQICSVTSEKSLDISGPQRGWEHFTEHAKSESHFENGTEHMRFVDGYIHNLEEFMRFDSHVGEYVALTELGCPSTLAAVNWFCRVYCKVSELFSVHKSVMPEVIAYPSKMAPLGLHNLLVCSVSGFYPGNIKVRWFLNGQEETAGIVSTGLISNGDWTYQILVMLEMTPKRGDMYTCQVEHSSLQRPAMLAQSESAQSKMLSGVGGLVLGLIFFGVGFVCLSLFLTFPGNQGSQPRGKILLPR
uniref:Ig-like domain-containing protein n=1 Tax=Vombatus ursinus TaxID=29139 RepID=A0A4X2KH47_VOMUR